MKIIGKISLDDMPKPKRKLRKDECYVSSSESNDVKIFRNKDKALLEFSKI